ncbi:MAG: hypothetical protein ACJ77E_11020 [Gaiellaceae bacterium]
MRALLPVAAVFVVLAAGCGGSSRHAVSTQTETAPPTTATAPTAATTTTTATAPTTTPTTERPPTTTETTTKAATTTQPKPKPKTDPKLIVGAVEDAAKYSTRPRAQMKLARASGFRAIVLSAVWETGASAAADLPALQRAAAAAVAEGIRPVVAIYQFSSSTPADPARRRAFVAYAAALAKALPQVRDVIIGNEPNLNLFWQPQFDDSGSDEAARDYEVLLAAAYDRLKEQDPGMDVIGGALAPHGGDRPSSRPTHSPTQFIRDLGAAYRASGRTKPIMDALSLHVYGDSQHTPPSFAHPRSTTIGIADYGKVVTLLRDAFGGTAQPGASLPIVYGEYGVETAIPHDKAYLYTGREVTSPVDEETQARFYDEAIRMAEAQPTVRMLFLFHVVDETRLEGLQSGTRYADGSPKASEAPVRRTLEAAADKTITAADARAGGR